MAESGEAGKKPFLRALAGVMEDIENLAYDDKSISTAKDVVMKYYGYFLNIGLSGDDLPLALLGKKKLVLPDAVDEQKINAEVAPKLPGLLRGAYSLGRLYKDKGGLQHVPGSLKSIGMKSYRDKDGSQHAPSSLKLTDIQIYGDAAYLDFCIETSTKAKADEKYDNLSGLGTHPYVCENAGKIGIRDDVFARFRMLN